MNDEILSLFVSACKNNYVDIARDIINRYKLDLNLGLRNACYYGSLDIVKILVQRGATNINDGMRYATHQEHISVIKYMIEVGACHKFIPKHLIVHLLNDGCNIDTRVANKLKNKRCQMQNLTRYVIDNIHIELYDINITNIICDYVPH